MIVPQLSKIILRPHHVTLTFFQLSWDFFFLSFSDSTFCSVYLNLPSWKSIICLSIPLPSTITILHPALCIHKEKQNNTKIVLYKNHAAHRSPNCASFLWQPPVHSTFKPHHLMTASLSRHVPPAYPVFVAIWICIGDPRMQSPWRTAGLQDRCSMLAYCSWEWFAAIPPCQHVAPQWMRAQMLLHTAL